MSTKQIEGSRCEFRLGRIERQEMFMSALLFLIQVFSPFNLASAYSTVSSISSISTVSSISSISTDSQGYVGTGKWRTFVPRGKVPYRSESGRIVLADPRMHAYRDYDGEVVVLPAQASVVRDGKNRLVLVSKGEVPYRDGKGNIHVLTSGLSAVREDVGIVVLHRKESAWRDSGGQLHVIDGHGASADRVRSQPRAPIRGSVERYPEGPAEHAPEDPGLSRILARSPASRDRLAINTKKPEVRVLPARDADTTDHPTVLSAGDGVVR